MTVAANSITPAQSSRNVWRYTAPSGANVDAVLVPEYWVHVSQQLRKGDLIEVTSEDMEWYAELLVRSVNYRVSATVALLSCSLFSGGSANAEGYTVKYKGKSERWCVIRDSDGVTVSSCNDTKDDAMQWNGFGGK